jgi:hypothetical protein
LDGCWLIEAHGVEAILKFCCETEVGKIHGGATLFGPIFFCENSEVSTR